METLSVTAIGAALLCGLLLSFTGPDDVHASNKGTKQIPRFTYMGQCENYPIKLPVFYNTTVALRAKNMYVMEGTVHVYRGTKRLGPIFINFTKCAEDGREDTCEHFASWKFPFNTCGMLEARDMFWSPLIRFEPEMAPCPVEEGNYLANQNNTLDMKKFAALKLPEHVMWKTKVLIHDEKSKPWGCLQIEGIIMNVRA